MVPQRVPFQHHQAASPHSTTNSSCTDTRKKATHSRISYQPTAATQQAWTITMQWPHPAVSHHENRHPEMVEPTSPQQPISIHHQMAMNSLIHCVNMAQVERTSPYHHCLWSHSHIRPLRLCIMPPLPIPSRRMAVSINHSTFHTTPDFICIIRVHRLLGGIRRHRKLWIFLDIYFKYSWK